MTNVTGRVAAGWTLPVEVLMKSAPAAIASIDALRTVIEAAELARLEDHLEMRPVAAGLLDPANLIEYLEVLAAERNAPRSMTMSTSSAPIATTERGFGNLGLGVDLAGGKVRSRPRQP